MGDINEYMSLLEAAKELGISRARIDQYVRDGRLQVEWLANQRFVLRTAVAELKKIPRPPGRPKTPPAAERRRKPAPKKKRKKS